MTILLLSIFSWQLIYSQDIGVSTLKNDTLFVYKRVDGKLTVDTIIGKHKILLYKGIKNVKFDNSTQHQQQTLDKLDLILQKLDTLKIEEDE